MKAILLFILSFVIFASCGKGASLSEAELLGLERCVAERPDSVYAVLKDVETSKLSPSALALYYLVRTEAEDKLYMTHTTDSLIALSRTYYETTDDAAHLAKAWYLTGRIHTDWEQWDKATADFLRAEELTEGSDDWGLKGRIAEYLGVVNNSNSLNKKALAYYKKAYIYFYQIPDSINMAYALKGQGIVYWSLGYADSSLLVFQQALAIQETKNNWRLLTDLYRRMGFICKKKKQYDAAYTYLCSAIRYSQKPPYRIYENLGDLFLLTGKLDSAYHYLQLALKPEAGLATRCVANYDMAEWAERMGKHTEALAYKKQYELLADSIEAKEQTEKVSEIQHQYSQTKTDKKYKQKNSVYRIGFIAVAFIFGILFLLYKKKKAQEFVKHSSEHSKKITSITQEATQQILHQESQKELLESQKQQHLKQIQEVLIARCRENTKVKKLYQTGWELNKENWNWALPEIEEIYEHTISRLKEAQPKMSEIELSICILTLMKIKTKQVASLLELQPSTITSYKRDIKKKYFAETGKKHLEECLMPYLG